VSTYVGGFEGGRDAPIGGLEVSLFGPGLEETVSTCMDGRAAFGPLEDGAYLLVPDFPEGDCMTKNCVRRLPEAIRAGGVKIVTFGDSVPVIGDAPMFPSRLATLLGDITDVNNTNIAIGGTTSHNWLPGTPNFENTLIPQISDADVIMVSLGGNDLLAFIQANAANLGNIAALVEDVKAEVNAILSRLITIVDAIREQNNTADIVYLLYPDYSRADMDMMWALVNQFVGAETVREVLETARDSLDASEDVILVDVFGSTQGTDVNTILADSLHFNDIGQTLYAEEIFKTLGGVLVGPSPLGGQPRTPLGTDQQFSLAP
jgi:lysophospholipase L1-like esterase